MKVKLAYGRQGMEVDLPEDVNILQPHFVAGVGDEPAALLHGIRNPIGCAPLNEQITSESTVVIVHTDITRATPNDRIMPTLIQELRRAGVRRENITLLNGLGTHRMQTGVELRRMLGSDIVDQYRCLQHDCHDAENLISLGATVLGHPVRINRTYMEADVKILTGFIEPHFFAGFSGGPKAVLPSLAGIESVFSNHGHHMISHPNATWGITEGNPIWEEMREVALRTQPNLLLNVTLNTQHQITGVFAGDLIEAHRQGCAFVKNTAMIPVDAPYDVVITTNSGYPLDQNLYQSVKGMSAALPIVRDGGVIIIAAACEDGLPDHGLYADLLKRAGTPEDALAMISDPHFEAQDQWQVQIQAQIQKRCDVYVYSDGLTSEQIRQALLKPARDIVDLVKTLRQSKGQRVCVMPDGPQTIPYIRVDA